MHIVSHGLRVLLVAIFSLSLSGCLLQFAQHYQVDTGSSTTHLVDIDAQVHPCSFANSFFDCAFGYLGFSIHARFSPGITSTLINWLDPIILQVPAGVTDVTGSFTGPGIGNLSITTVTGPLQVDATQQLVPDPGSKFLIIDFPGSVPSGGAGLYHFQFNFKAPNSIPSPLSVKVMAAAKVTVSGQSYYLPLLPCTTNMANVPTVTFPTANMFTPINVTSLQTQSGCNDVTYNVGGAAAGTVSVIEYRNSDFDHYFMTPNPTDIQLLDSKTPPFQAWSRTGRSFNAYPNATAPAASVAVCRFFNSNFGSKSSHFFALHGFGCEDTINFFPDWTLEYDKYFNTLLPDVNSACAGGTVPLYRLYNQGMGGAPNHRFVTSLIDKQDMINQGWVDEGVRMCLPS
ncbi:MAG: hypothetical protein ABI607_00730 [Betaproteobacteria bacterium]